MINRRHLNIIKKRLINLPSGRNLIDYALNTLKLIYTLKRKTLKVPYPNSVMLELTNHCQLRCITCAREYSFGAEMKKGNVPLENAKKIIDQLSPYLDKIALTGLGEPVIYPYIVEIVDYIRQKNNGIAIFISSNAQLPSTVDVITKLKDKIDTLQISVDGIGEVMEKIRLKSDYSYFLENLKAVAKLSETSRMDVKLNMVVFKDNFFQMTEVVKLAKDLGLKEVYFNSVNLVANDWDLSHYEIYDTPEFGKELKRVIEFADKENIYIEYPKFGMEKGFINCPYLWNHFYITWDGFLAPCCAKPFPLEMNFGNVFETPFLDCINHDKFIKFRRLAKDNLTHGFCKRCHYIA